MLLPMRSIDPESLEEALEANEAVFDTRSSQQFDRDGLPGTRNLTLEQVQAGRLPELDRGAPVYLICERGLISDLVGQYLEAAGFRDVRNLGGGLIAWRAHLDRDPQGRQAR